MTTLPAQLSYQSNDAANPETLYPAALRDIANLDRAASAYADIRTWPGYEPSPLLRLDEPLSFWGGVDPGSGVITQPRHPQHGHSVAGTVLAMPRGIGSSSSSAVLLELLHLGRAPRALLMGEVDAILALGVVVAREMGFATVAVVECDVTRLPGGVVRVARDGTVVAVGPGDDETN